MMSPLGHSFCPSHQEEMGAQPVQVPLTEDVDSPQGTKKRPKSGEDMTGAADPSVLVGMILFLFPSRPARRVCALCTAPLPSSDKRSVPDVCSGRCAAGDGTYFCRQAIQKRGRA